MTDIDIDFLNRDKALADLQYVFAVERGDERRRHRSGVYFHDIPVDPVDHMAAWDYEVAEQKGFFKIDLLHNTIYRHVRNETHLVDLLTTEPPWEKFADRAIVAKLAHIGKHYDTVQTIRPQCIEDLAICLALVRPGKLHLIGRPRAEIDRDIWLPASKYYFKRAHAISYAAAIVVQLNLLIENHAI